MTKLILTLMASAAISATALAQQQGPTQPPKQDQMQQQPMQKTEPQQQGPAARQPGASAQQQISPRTLKGEEMRMLQQALNDKGGTNIKVDGRFGPQTAAALRQFQQQKGLQATGRLDTQTLAALGAPIPGADDKQAPSGRQQPPSVSPGAPPSGQQQQAPKPGGTQQAPRY